MITKMSLLFCHLAPEVSGVSSRLHSPLKQNFFSPLPEFTTSPRDKSALPLLTNAHLKNKNTKKIQQLHMILLVRAFY